MPPIKWNHVTIALLRTLFAPLDRLLQGRATAPVPVFIDEKTDAMEGRR